MGSRLIHQFRRVINCRIRDGDTTDSFRLGDDAEKGYGAIGCSIIHLHDYIILSCQGFSAVCRCTGKEQFDGPCGLFDDDGRSGRLVDDVRSALGATREHDSEQEHQTDDLMPLGHCYRCMVSHARTYLTWRLEICIIDSAWIPVECH